MEVQHWLKENNLSCSCKFISQPSVPSRSYTHDGALPVIGFLPGGYCGCRSRAPPLHAPPSARLIWAVQQGELSQLLLSDLVVVVLRETKYQRVLLKKKKGEKKGKNKDICLLTATDARNSSKRHQIKMISTRARNTWRRWALTTRWGIFSSGYIWTQNAGERLEKCGKRQIFLKRAMGSVWVLPD